MLFQAKFDRVYQIIHDGIHAMKRPYLSLSWGKDSVACLWFVRRVFPKITCVYFNSGYALPDTYLLRDRLIKEWDLNYIEVPAAVDYIELCREIGLPHERSKRQQQKAVAMIKKANGNTFAKEHGFDGNFWGLRADESIGRKKLFAAKSPLFCCEHGLWRCAPFAWVKQQELWYWIDHLHIPYNAVYDKTLLIPRERIRNSGWLSTDNAQDGHIAWLRYYYPDLYNRLLSLFPETSSYV